MGYSGWCVDCNKVIRGKSFKYGLCYKCRQEPVNKIYCSNVDIGITLDRKKIAEELKGDIKLFGINRKTNKEELLEKFRNSTEQHNLEYNYRNTHYGFYSRY